MNLARNVNQTLSLGLRQICLTNPAAAELTKRPVNSFLLFRNEKYPEMKKRNPTLKVTEIASKLSMDWKILPQTQKDKYIEQYRTLNEQYRMERAKLSKMELEEEKQERKEDRIKRKIKKVKADLRALKEDRPSRPTTQFGQFVLDNHAKLRGTATEKISKLAVDWSNLKPDQKAAYEKRYLSLQGPYMSKLKEWQAKIKADGRKEKIALLQKELAVLRASEPKQE